MIQVPDTVDRTQEHVDERLRKLQQGYEALTTSENFKAWLDLLATQYHYSANNLILIWMQCPNASLIKGYNQWRDFKRHVRKGEKSIKIYAPVFRKDENDVQRLVTFRSVSVFDISQTDGQPLPLHELTFNEDGPETPEVRAMRFHLEQHLNNMAVDVRCQILDDGTGGYFKPATREIVLNDTHSTMRQFKTLLHEVAHLLTFDTMQKEELAELTKSDHELVAESVAYVGASHVGIDTQEFSTNYLALYTRTAEQLHTLLPIIRDLSKSLIFLLQAPQLET